MAKNTFGFIQNGYRQPDYYKECVERGVTSAFYKAENGRLFVIEAHTAEYGCSTIGNDIVKYRVGGVDSDPLFGTRISNTQKEAMEMLEKLLAENMGEPIEKVFVFTAEQAWDGEVADIIVKAFGTEALAKKYMHDFIHVDDGDYSIAKSVKRNKWVVDINEPTLYRAYAKFGDYANNHVECTITECEIAK